MDTNGGYVYSIDSTVYKENYAQSRDSGYNYIIKNNNVIIRGTNAMAEGIYLDALINGIVEDNFVNITSTAGDNYGMAISYSYAHHYLVI